ncbi:MAG: polyribonucleotide nucleotidyltransferase [Patescibacteria group bacterium]|nr:polyribonucleotide nucleotidyltransferase [Patescibacteria group bacterium]
MKKEFTLKIGEKDLIVEVNDFAEQSNGSVFIRYGETLLLVTAVMSKQEKKGIDFFPLTVAYEERFYAAGKILGSRYLRRESRPSDQAILTSRLIDRAIRPRFPKSFQNEVQVVATCLSWDTENDPDVLGVLGASLALSISDIPWSGPIAALRISKINGSFVFNPSYLQREKNELDIVWAGMEKSASNSSGNMFINMIEGEAKETDEKTILEAYEFAELELKKIIDFQNKIIKEIGKEKIKLESAQRDEDLEKEIKDFLGNKLEEITSNANSSSKIDEIKDKLVNFVEEKNPEKTNYAKKFFEEKIEGLIHKNIITEEKRPDGRKLDEVREICCEAGLLPRTHGSGFFKRGKTKSLSILTLGSPGDQKLLEGMEITGKKRFMHHYNFPPYCSGEVKPMRGPGRREIGHGMLAEKALVNLIPEFEDFPYTIRIVTEILSSNGSTSMASVTSSSLALMDAGVPIKSPATGIAIGLMTDEKGNYKILTDIQGPEDHYGDMDLKIAGTKNGITAIQMDVKIEGINKEILEQGLNRGKKARTQILEKMKDALPETRNNLSRWAPQIHTIQIKPEKIREIIGPGGKVIHEITEKCDVSIDIQEDGKVFVTAEKEESAQKAITWIKNMVHIFAQDAASVMPLM